MRVISRPDKPPQDEDEEVLADEDEVEDETDGDDVEDEAEEGDSDTEMTDAAALEAGVDEEAERPQGMDIDNGVPSTSDRVRPEYCTNEREIVIRAISRSANLGGGIHVARSVLIIRGIKLT